MKKWQKWVYFVLAVVVLVGPMLACGGCEDGDLKCETKKIQEEAQKAAEKMERETRKALDAGIGRPGDAMGIGRTIEKALDKATGK